MFSNQQDNMQKLPEVRRDYLAKIVDAVKEDLRSRSEEDMEVDYPDVEAEDMEVEVEDMEVDYPDIDKQVAELCSQFDRLSL